VGEKDITEKTLLAYNDVFADIVNVLLFDGKKILNPENLEDASSISMYKADDSKLHEQERDVSKYWKNKNVKIAMTGIENQTVPEMYMPLRVIGYDGASYRSELILKKPHNTYPVVTLVLYYGIDKWDKPINLVDCFIIPDELKSYVNNYKINLFEIAFLDEEKVKMFQSDFGIVADYFVQKRKYRDYKPSRIVIKHVDEVLKLLSIFADEKYLEISANFNEGEKGEITMCEIVDQFIARGVSQGIEQGIEQGIVQGIAQGEIKRDEEYKTALELKESGNTNVSDYRDKGISDEVIKIVLRIDQLD
jgi:hypothetical protein